jgi:hypothetical protein
MSRLPRDIEEDIRIARDRLALLTAELESVLVENCGVKVGEIVMARPPGLGPPDLQEAIVRSVDPRFSPPWLTVSFRKKDGQWADRENNAYGRWEKKT